MRGRSLILAILLLLTSSVLVGFRHSSLETFVPADRSVGANKIAVGAVRAEHYGEPIDTLFGLLTLRFDDARRDISDSIFMRMTDSIPSGAGGAYRGPYPWLKGTIFCCRPEETDTSYYGGARLAHFSVPLATLHDIEAAGWEIGGHSKGHILTQAKIMWAGPKYDLAGIETQVGDNYRYLADTCGFDVSSYAFPNIYGGCTAYIRTVERYFDRATAVSALTAVDSVSANSFLSYDRFVNDWYVGTTSDRTPYGVRHGNLIDRYNVPGNKEFTTGQTKAELRDWIKNLAESKSWGVMLVHSAYQHYSGGAWLPGGPDADCYFDDFLDVVDSLVANNVLRVVTLKEGMDRVTGRITRNANFIWPLSDWDADGIPDGHAQTAAAWDDLNAVLHTTGGWNDMPYATITFGTNPIRWYVGPRPPAGAIMEFSMLVRGVTASCNIAVNPMCYVSPMVGPAQNIVGLNVSGTHWATTVTTSHTTNVGHWNVYTSRVDSHYETDALYLYISKVSGTGTVIEICNPELRIIGGSAPPPASGY